MVVQIPFYFYPAFTTPLVIPVFVYLTLLMAGKMYRSMPVFD